jgi:serine/threonine protein phosphatase PrpC
VNVVVGAKTDVGLIRTANEDSYLAKEHLFVVADGMGGHVAGDVASRTAIGIIEDRSSEASAEDLETLARLVREANRAIWQKAQEDSSLRGMGTTCTLVLVDERKAHIAHVGDSRAYRLRKGQLEQLTEDHTLVARMVREGKIRPEEADRHPHGNIVTRALGVDSDVSVDVLSFEIEPGDRFLLCSDGLSSMLDHESIADVLTGEEQPQIAAELLVDLANEAGGEDNITVIIVDVTDGGSTQASGGASSHAPAPPDPPARAQTPVELPPEVRVSRSLRGWLRRLTVLVVVGVLIGGGVWAADYSLAHSWFVGVNEQGFVTIYRGIPEEVAGLSFREQHEVTGIALADLPEWKRGDVRAEMKFDSFQEARTNVSNLERISRDFTTSGTARDAGGP